MVRRVSVKRVVVVEWSVKLNGERVEGSWCSMATE